MNWSVVDMTADEVHVVPIEDLITHTFKDCVCVPSAKHIERVDGSTGRIMVHHSLDGREVSPELRIKK